MGPLPIVMLLILFPFFLSLARLSTRTLAVRRAAEIPGLERTPLHSRMKKLSVRGSKAICLD